MANLLLGSLRAEPGLLSLTGPFAQAHVVRALGGKRVGDWLSGHATALKVNQIGTVTETLEAMRICREADYTQMVSHRSGETAFIADLVVGTGCGQIKSGAPARGERVAKYNRLLELAAAHPELPFGTGDL